MEEVPAGETEETGVDVDKSLKNYDLEGKELDASAFDLGEYEDVLKEAGVENDGDNVDQVENANDHMDHVENGNVEPVENDGHVENGGDHVEPAESAKEGDKEDTSAHDDKTSTHEEDPGDNNSGNDTTHPDNNTTQFSVC